MQKFHLLALLTLLGSTSVISIESVKANPSFSSALLLSRETENETIVEVTGVRINSTPDGIEVILETSEGTFSEPIARTEDNTSIFDIPNAVLALSDREEFQADNPAEGIGAVSVTQIDASIIRVSITGETSAPVARVTASDRALVLNVTPTEEESDIELTVIGEPTGYVPPDSAAVTRTDIWLRDLPYSVRVVPQQVIEDQRALNVGEIVRNVSGFAQSGKGGGRNEFSLLTRGFTADQFRDGFSEGNNVNRVFAEISNLERVEILKGPATLLYGQAEPGGVANLVTKQPLEDPYYAGNFIAGNYDFYRPTLDLSGPLDADGNLKYRLNFAYENAGSFRDRVESERIFVAPKLSWDVTSNTTIRLQGEYLDDSRPVDFGLVAVGNRPADIAIDRFLGDPTRKNDVYQRRGYAFLDHRFNEDWSLKSGFRTTSSDQYFSAILARSGGRVTGGGGTGTGTGGSPLQPDNRTLLLSAQNSNQFFDTNTIQTNLIGKFSTGTIEHAVLIGFELGNETRETQTENADAGSIDLFQPTDNFPIGRFTKTINRNELTDLFGFYLQDLVSLTDNLKVLLGGRFNLVDFDLIDNLRASKTNTYSNAVSPQVGIVFQPTEAISLYANYSRSFVPQSGSSFNGTPFEPEIGEQYELGLKADFLDGLLSSNLAIYEIIKNNVLTADLDRPTFQVQTGEQLSRGIELDLLGEILPGWNIIAAYAYTDAFISRDNTFPVGNPLANVPLNAFNLWSTYQIQNGDLQGLGFGAGVFAASDRPGDLNNSFTLPEYARFDGTIYYDRGVFRAALNIKNLFDTRYFETAQSRTQIFPGAPLTVLGSVSWRF